MRGLTLAVSCRCAAALPEIAAAWKRSGGAVEIVDRFWTDQGLVSEKTKLYGNELFCRTIADTSKLSLISPRDELLASLELKWTRRSIVLERISDLTDRSRQGLWPRFIKPAKLKRFPAAVYVSLEEALYELASVPRSTMILSSEVVGFRNEARAFIADGEVMDCQFYIGNGDQVRAASFAKSLAEAYHALLPSSFVVDIGEIQGGWAVIEFNAAWISHPRRCDPRRILASIAGGTMKEAT